MVSMSYLRVSLLVEEQTGARTIANRRSAAPLRPIRWRDNLKPIRVRVPGRILSHH
jgi:hypothetical protein